MKQKITFFIVLFIVTSVHLLSKEPEKLIFLKEQASKQKTAEAYLYVTEYYIKNKIHDESLYRYLDSAYQAAVDEKSDLYLGQYYYQKSRLYENSDSAAIYRDCLKKNLYHYEKIGITAYHPYNYMSIGISFMLASQLDSAVFYLKKGLGKYQDNPQLPTTEVHKLIYTFLTHTYKAGGLNDSALVYAHKTINLSAQLKDSATLSNYLYTLAVIYQDMGKIPECLKYFQSSAEMAIKLGNSKLAASNYNDIASVLNAQKKSEKALAFAQLAIKYAKEAHEKDLEGNAWSAMGLAYKNQKKYDEAAEHYKKAMSCYAETKNEMYHQLMQSALMELYAETKQQDSAWAYMEQLEAKNDELTWNDSLFPFPLPLYELQLKQKALAVTADERKVKLDVVKQQYLEQKAASLRQRIWFICGISGLIILLLLLWINRQRQKLKAERLSRYAKEKEDEFFALQKDTELRLIRKYIDGLESERKRIAKDLHDGICNDLLALEMEMKLLLNKEEEAKRLIQLLSETRESARSISHRLMPPVFQDANLNEMISDYVLHLDLPRKTIADYQSTENIDWNKIPQETAYEIYRIVQEALSNCIKHASATHVQVLLMLKDNVLQMVIQDNGIGFEKTRKTKGIGLRTIAERVKSIGGNLEIDSNKGTYIKITVHL